MHYGVSDMAEIAKITGLDYMSGILAGKYPAPPIAEVMNFGMQEVSKGRVVFAGTPGPNHLNPMGSVHGGWAAAILDSALACCVQTLCPIGYASTSAELKVNFVRPIMANTGRLICTGEVIHPGRQLATSQARLVDENGKLFAHGSQTCSVFKVPV